MSSYTLGITKKQTKGKAMKTVYTFLEQIVKYIPRALVERVANRYDCNARNFTPFAHIVALMTYQLGHLSSLNSVCDLANAYENQWCNITHTTSPCRNTFSYANMTRDPKMIEDLFWALRDHLIGTTPDFYPTQGKGFIHRFKRPIYAIDSSTIQLVLNCMDWAKHRRQKAAAKLHLTFDVKSLLPHVAIVESAGHHDSTRAPILIESLKNGDVCIADRAYLDFDFLDELDHRGIFFVIREKQNLCTEVVKDLSEPHELDTSSETIQILSDQEIKPSKLKTALKYSGRLRRVKAYVEVDKQMRVMTFLTNNFAWSPRTITELYKARWNIEIFFKEFKQTCQLQSFLGYSENAIKWQVWSALLVHLLLRYIAFLSKWKGSFSRLVALIRNTLWKFSKLIKFLETNGTARRRRNRRRPPPMPYIQEILLFTVR